MRIWKLENPWDNSFAFFDGTGRWAETGGTWQDPKTKWETVADRYGVCAACTAPSPSKRLPGLTIEWQPGSDRIGDFSWDVGGGWPVITETVLRKLRARFCGFEGVPVEMTQNPKLKRPSRPNKRTKPRIWLPYEGPKLYNLWITARVEIDHERSSARLKRKCSRCGREDWEVDGVEWHTRKFDLKLKDMVPIDKPREAGKGFFVREAEVKQAGFFSIEWFWGWMLCTDDVKQVVEDQGYTNVTFWEMGDTI